MHERKGGFVMVFFARGIIGWDKHESLLKFAYCIYLGSGVDIGPCLEELLHHTGVAFVGFSDKCRQVL